jgi:diadenosine tetraphosphate (Ap4A) HIT family hydrolase
VEFALHPNLEKKLFIADLPLCRVLMEDEKHYPWLFLVPRVPGVAKLMDLKPEDQLQLIQELDFAQKILWEAFHPVQLNVAAIGNKTPQLHIHVIARFESDPAWPHTVWDHPVRSLCDESLKSARVSQLKQSFTDFAF